MKAVICVGGDGERAGGRIKPLMEKQKKNILERIIESLKKQNIKQIILLTNGKRIFDCLGYKTVNTFSGLKKILKEDFLLIVGDSLIDFDFEEFHKFHKMNKHIPTILTSTYTIPYGVIENGKWIERPVKEIAVGAFILHPTKLNNLFDIPKIFSKEFKCFNGVRDLLHITTLEDYKRWKK